MSMTATASIGMTGRDEGSSPLILSPRALRLPVAVSLLLHASVFAGILYWWQASGAPAPKGLPEGLSVTFVDLSSPPSPAPAAPHMQIAPVEPKPVIEPKPEPVVEEVPAPVVPPEPAVVLDATPEPRPYIQPEPVQAAHAQAEPATQQVASLAPPSRETGTGPDAPRGFEKTDGKETDQVIISEPRYRSTPLPYPRRARDLGQEGTARVRVKIDPRGLPSKVLLLESSGYALLDHAAVKAVGRWTFEPPMHGGRPVSGWAEVPVVYVLN
jgi:protein TonB